MMMSITKVSYNFEIYPKRMFLKEENRKYNSFQKVLSKRKSFSNSF